jgi:ketosteroid isomerase-like protein
MRRLARPNRVPYLLLIVLLTTLPLPSLLAQHHNKHTAHNEILALERQWRTAQLSNDVAAMDKLLSDDYLGITSTGDVLTKTQQLDRMRTRALSVTNLDFSDIKIKLVGQIAIVTSLAHVQGVSDNHSLDGSYRYTRIYQHLPTGSWKITNFEITRIRGSHPTGAASTPATPSPSNDPPTS